MMQLMTSKSGGGQMILWSHPLQKVRGTSPSPLSFDPVFMDDGECAEKNEKKNIKILLFFCQKKTRARFRLILGVFPT